MTHRIQAWDFSKGDIPDLTDTESNLVVPEAKIHNDASVDISEDGTLLVTLVPSNMPMQTLVGVYGLNASNKGRKIATHSLEYPPVSVSLSPTTKYLLVGYSMRHPRSRLAPFSLPSDPNLMAQIFYMQTLEGSGDPGSSETIQAELNSRELMPRMRLVHQRDLHQNEHAVHLNCIRWIPVAGMGMVYATNTGIIKILR